MHLLITNPAGLGWDYKSVSLKLCKRIDFPQLESFQNVKPICSAVGACEDVQSQYLKDAESNQDKPVQRYIWEQVLNLCAFVYISKDHLTRYVAVCNVQAHKIEEQFISSLYMPSGFYMLSAK